MNQSDKALMDRRAELIKEGMELLDNIRGVALGERKYCFVCRSWQDDVLNGVCGLCDKLQNDLRKDRENG